MALPTTLFPGCGAATHPVGRTQCPIYNQAYFCCQKVSYFAKVCHNKATRCNLHTMATQIPASTPTVKHLTISIIQKASADEATPYPYLRYMSPQQMALGDWKSFWIQVLISRPLEQKCYNIPKRTFWQSPSLCSYSQSCEWYQTAPLGKLPVKLHLGSHIWILQNSRWHHHNYYYSYDSNIKYDILHVRQFPQRCAEKQIALNPQKCTFCPTEVTFAGFRLSTKGYKVDQSIAKAISQFPKPTNCTELLSFVNRASWFINFPPVLILWQQY